MKILPHCSRQAAKKPAIMQMMTFWKNVACISSNYKHVWCQRVRSVSPETPLFRRHNPAAEEQVGDGVREHAGAQAARAIGDPIIERTGDGSCRPISGRMHEHK